MTRKKAPPTRSSTVAQQKLFLANFAKIGNITTAATLSGLDRMRHYEWLADAEKYPDYRDRFQQAHEQLCDRIEQSVIQWGVYGWERPIYQGGRRVGTEHVHDTKLTEMAAKAWLPHKYRERLDITGANGGPIQTQDLSAVPLPDLQARLLRAIDVLASDPPPPGPPIEAVASLAPVGKPLALPPPESEEARLAAYERAMAERKAGKPNGKGNGHG